ncbi:MAG: hypothetical protein VYC34_02980, partial [Planctomycetota bacterium]|nr:hypothetical protein [Planctomycetota bacterium]
DSREWMNAAPRAVAEGGEIGEQFHYTIEAPITIERQRSAMVPIINTKVEGRRVSIYSAGRGEKHPMRGVEMTNDTGLHMMPGPISVYDGGAFAGDAQIEHTSRGAERLLSYAVDLDVQAQEERKEDRSLTSVRIVDGLLLQEFKRRAEATYSLKSNDSQRGRTVLVEHPKRAGWELVSPKQAAETTDDLLRFEVRMDASGEASLEVVEERVEWQRVAMSSVTVDSIVAFAAQGKASKQVVEAVRKAAELQATVNELSRRIDAAEGERREIFEDQSRIRDNMSRVSHQSDLYARYMQKLNEQETRLEEIQERLDGLLSEKAAAERAVNEFLKDLDVR